jgi:hypothetical protein
MADVSSVGLEKKLGALDRPVCLFYVIRTYHVTPTAPLIMGLEQNILAFTAIILFINPLNTEKEKGCNYMSIQCSPIAERALLKCIPLKEMVHTLLPLVPSCQSNTRMKIGMENWWKCIARGEPKYTQKSMSQWHFIQQKSHID